MFENYINPHDLIVFGCGVLFGSLIVILINFLIKGRVKTIAHEILMETETQKIQELDTILSGIKESFGALSFDALSRNTQEFLRLADQTLSKQTELGEKELENKKNLIDQTLVAIKDELLKVENHVISFEKDREQKFGQLSNQLKITAEKTSDLQDTTSKLKEVLANTRQRGQWGERMAEDVLRFAGLIEGINYNKQKNIQLGLTRPDFTFLLPRGLKVNMDVKFPLDNYLRFLEAEVVSEKTTYKNKFLKDVRDRMKEVTSKNYINTEENTIDYVIVFIPNEQVYSFIQENDNHVMDEALMIKVILCSPITLYAVLTVIRQAVDNFTLQQTTKDMLSLYGAFNKQWINYINCFNKLGDKIEEVQKEYNALTTTRTNQVERAINKIDDLRKQNSLAIANISDENEHIPEQGDVLHLEGGTSTD